MPINFRNIILDIDTLIARAIKRRNIHKIIVKGNNLVLIQQNDIHECKTKL